MSIIDPNMQVYSDDWWLQVLRQRLIARTEGRDWRHSRWSKTVTAPQRPGLDLLWDYFRGEPPLPHCTEQWGADMYPFLRMGRMNYAEMCVGAVSERLVATGWHTSLDDDPDGDQEAARIAGVNDFNDRLADLATYMLTLGDGYMIVGGMMDEGAPAITVEDPREVITAEDPVTGRTIMGYKETVDEWTGNRLQYLYGPGWVRRSYTERNTGIPEWLGPREPLPNHGDSVAVVRFRNKHGVGDYERHLDALDRINDGIFSRITIAKYQAFRQRAFIGLPSEDEFGEPITYEADAFVSSPGTAWRMPVDAKVWESMYVDLTPLRMAIKDDVEGFFAATRTPLHYISADAAQGSAEGASMQKESHVFRVEDRRRRVDNGLSKVMSLAFKVMGDAERSEAWKINTIWAPIERYSLASKSAAASTLLGGGKVLPLDSVLTDVLQYTPADLPRIHAQRDADALFDPAADATLNAMQAPQRAPALDETYAGLQSSDVGAAMTPQQAVGQARAGARG